MALKSALDVLFCMAVGIGIGTYLFQWASLMYEIVEGEVKNKREIIWKVIPFGFLLLIVWKWQELSKKEFVYEAEVVDEREDKTNDDARLKIYGNRK